MSSLTEERPAPTPTPGTLIPTPAPLARLHDLLLRPGVAFYAWLVPLLITIAGGALRFYRLGFPHSVIFDETYYVKDGYSLWQSGYERNWDKDANDLFNQGDPSGILDTGEYVVHPPLGKWLIGAGEQLFGVQSSFGWRFAAALFGTISIFVVARLAVRMFKSVWMGAIAGILIAADGEHFVHSRTSLLDLFVMFFVVAGFACIVMDREWADLTIARRLGLAIPDAPGGAVAGRGAGGKGAAGGRVAAVTEGREDGPLGPPASVAEAGSRAHATSRWRYLASGLNPVAFAAGARVKGLGPFLGLRPWRLAAGISLGLAMGVKWSGIYVIAAIGILTVLWDWGRRRRAGISEPFWGAFLKDALLAFVAIVPVGFVVYLLCWTGWIVTSGGYGRDWASQNHGWWTGTLPDWLVSLAHYHYTAYKFHVGLDSEHPYMSNPWGWIVQWRPTSFYYESPKLGESGCTVDNCSQAITSVGNPVLWGLAPIAVLALVGFWLLRRDWRAGALLCGLLAAWGPWFTYQHRTIFTFYTIVMVPFVVLAVTYCLGKLWGNAAQFGTGVAVAGGLGRRIGGSQSDGLKAAAPGDGLHSRAAASASGLASVVTTQLLVRRVAVGVILAGAIVLFAYFYPVYTGATIPYDDWRNHMFNASWI